MEIDFDRQLLAEVLASAAQTPSHLARRDGLLRPIALPARFFHASLKKRGAGKGARIPAGATPASSRSSGVCGANVPVDDKRIQVEISRFIKPPSGYLDL
jgi:hypothetical protein